MSTSSQIVFVGLATLVILSAWFVLYAFALSAVQEHHDQRVMFSHLRQELALATAPIGGSISPGTPVGLVSIPALGKRAVVFVEGTSSKDLEAGPGHLPSSPLPGQAGNAQIYGRAATFGAPFKNLMKLRAGDAINITTGQGTFTYDVIDVRVPGDRGPAALAAGGSRVTLVSTRTDGISGGWAPGGIVFVDADLASGEKVQPTPTGAPTAVPAYDGYYKSYTGNLIPLVLWLQLLVVSLAGGLWAWHRWAKPQTWVVALPVVVAVLWGATSAAFPLLPNLY